MWIMWGAFRAWWAQRLRGWGRRGWGWRGWGRRWGWGWRGRRWGWGWGWICFPWGNYMLRSLIPKTRWPRSLRLFDLARWKSGFSAITACDCMTCLAVGSSRWGGHAMGNTVGHTSIFIIVMAIILNISIDSKDIWMVTWAVGRGYLCWLGLLSQSTGLTA